MDITVELLLVRLQILRSQYNRRRRLKFRSSAKQHNKNHFKIKAEATNAAAGATLSLNIIDGIVLADMGGYANVSGKAEITANAYTVDESDAYATSKGVQLKRQENKFGKSIDDILNGKGADDESKLPASQKVLNGDDSVHNDEKSPLGDNRIDELAETKNVDQQTGNTSQGTKVSVAAAVVSALLNIMGRICIRQDSKCTAYQCFCPERE